ncbi:hypothetical protein [Demequina sp. NBRC 110054]|uniref:hypothetical protein n=1 Tax=Demequina sp. NBRC 110054 TaxID=1570343 RepID=UPI0009FC536B|nr:hypothetical protein [Demequina sp. NBRC 110054]
MISFQDMEATLLLAVALSVIVIVVAALSEGRGEHLLDLIQRMRQGNAPQEGILEHEVPREGYEWSVVGRLDSPTRDEDGDPRPRLKDVVAVKDRLPAVKDRLPAVKDRLPEVRSALPALKDLPVLRSLAAPQEAPVDTTGTPVLADTASR